MSTIETPEIASVYGALDSAAFEDGGSYNAHLLRELARSANRLASKGQHLLTLPFTERASTPSYNGDSDSLPAWTYFEGLRTVCPTTQWVRITPRIPIPKRAGLRSAAVRVDARVSSDHEVLLQVATRAAPFDINANGSSPNVVTLTGDGDDDVDLYSGSGIPIHHGAYEHVELYVRGLRTGNLANTTYGGTPNQSSGLINGNGGYVLRRDRVRAVVDTGTIIGSSASWVVPGWGQAGAEIVFYDRQGQELARRPVTVMSQDPAFAFQELWFAPPLTESEFQEAAFTQQYGGPTDNFELYDLPNVGIVCFSMAAEARTE